MRYRERRVLPQNYDICRKPSIHSGRDSGEERSNEQPEKSDAFDTDDLQGDAESTIDDVTKREQIENTLAEVNLPSGLDTAKAIATFDAIREHPRVEGPSTKTPMVRAVMPAHPLGYADADTLDKIKDCVGYRGEAWWRKIIQPDLDIDREVEHCQNHHDYNLCDPIEDREGEVGLSSASS